MIPKRRRPQQRNAPTKKFEYDVGNKTTFDIANKENCLKLAQGVHRWRRPASTLIMWEAHSRVIRNQVYVRFPLSPSLSLQLSLSLVHSVRDVK